MRVGPARQGEQPAAVADQSEHLLRLLEEEGFGIARRSYAPREAIGEEDQGTTLRVLTSGTAFLLWSTPLSGEVALRLLKEGDAFGNLAFAARIRPRKTLTRLAGTLLFLSERLPEKNPCGAGPVAIGVRLTQDDLAAMIVSSRGSVGAAMTKMRRRGIVDVRDGIVTVLAPEKLREASVGKSGRTASTTRRRASPGHTVVPP